MNKKFLSAILFGALMVTSTGTFVSCKDYDDDIDGINKELSEIKSQIKELQDKVGAGKYVTGVAASDEGLTVTFNDGSTVPVKVGGAATTLTLDAKTGEFSIDGKGTGLFATNGEAGEVLVPYVNEEDGYWYFYNKEGKAEKSEYKAAGNAYAVVANGVCTLNIPDADGKMQTVKLPTMAAAITSLKLAQGTGVIDLSTWAPMVFAADANQMKNLAGTAWAKKAVVSPYNADGTKGCYVDVVIEPTNIDVNELTFNLQNSKGVTVFANGVVAEAPTLQAKAAATTGVHRIYFAYKDGLTKDDLAGDNAIITADDALAVVCGNVSTSYDLKNGYTDPDENASGEASVAVPEGSTYVKLGEAYSIFGKGYNGDPSKPSATEQAFLTAFTGVTDYKLSVDAEYAKTYGVTIDGDSFTISSADAYGVKIPLTVTYTSAKTTGSTEPATTKIDVTVQSKPVVGAITLKASHVLSTKENAKYAYIPLADLANAITGADKIAWNDANGLTYETIVDNDPVANVAIQLTSAKKYSGNNLKITAHTTADETDELVLPTDGTVLVKADRKTEATNLKEAAYIKVEVVPTNANVTADVYSGLIEFTFGSDNRKATATVELTLTNPESAISRIPLFFNGDNLIAYGTSNGTNISYDVTSAYNGVEDENAFKVEAKAEKDKKWTVGADGKTVTIPVDKLYKETQEFEVTYNYFENATNNSHTETIYITGQSPIKDGEITVSKTTLNLTENEDTFLSADVAGKDAFGKTYKLLNSFTKETMEGETVKVSAAAKDVMDERIDGIELVATGDNREAVKVDAIYQKINSSKLEVTNSGDSEGKLVGWTISIKDASAIQNGATIEFKLTIKDKWGVQLPAKTITLTVKNN